jgi:Zn-dependent protease
MTWSFRIARIAGIDVRIHWTFFLLLLWLGAGFARSEAGVGGAVIGLLFVLAIFLCVVLHEFGHALTARRFGIHTLDVTLLPIGGVARLERMPRDPVQELLVAIAGPLVNVVIALLLAGVVFLVAGMQAFAPARWEVTGLVTFVANLMWTNVALVLFNLLPAFPMDGGRVLRALLATRGDRLRATQIAASVGQMVAIGFGIIGLFANPLLLFVALFVYLGAEAESRAEWMNSVLGDLPVRAAMLTHFRTLHPRDSLERARDELLAGSQQDFPVVDETGLCGILSRQDLVEGLRTAGPSVAVGDRMQQAAVSRKSADMLGDAVREMNEKNLGTLPVVDDHRLVGLLTRENLGELLMLREAERSFAGRGSK